jgi:ABC-2 type transport system ATP-binding protein
MIVVRVDGLTKRYGDVTALDGVSFELAENTIHGLLGRNGAGKSTIMQILTGQRFETAGTVEVFGRHPYENADVLSRVCAVMESQRYPDNFKVRHALRAAEIAFPHWDAAFAAELVADFALPADRRIKKLSRGMVSAVGVIIGLASRAPLTFFDEPYLGLDAVARQLFYDRLLTDYVAHPRTVVLSTHLIDEVSDLIENVVVIDRGKVLIDADAETLRSEAVTVTGRRRRSRPSSRAAMSCTASGWAASCASRWPGARSAVTSAGWNSNRCPCSSWWSAVPSATVVRPEPASPKACSCSSSRPGCCARTTRSCSGSSTSRCSSRSLRPSSSWAWCSSAGASSACTRW